MTLTVTVLGGAAAWPNPGQGCSSYLVRSAETSLVLDCGPNTALELRKHVAWETVDPIVISHMHSDHMLDLVTYRYGLTYGAARPARPISVYLPPGGIVRLQRLADAFADQGETQPDFWATAFDLHEYNPTVGVSVGDLTVVFRRTQHPLECYAMRVTDGSASLTYTADTGAIAPLVAFSEGSDLLICEATLDDHGDVPVDERGHLTPEDAGDLAARAGVQSLVLSHLWSERSAEAVQQRATRRFGGRVLIAEVGLVLNV